MWGFMMHWKSLVPDALLDNADDWKNQKQSVGLWDCVDSDTCHRLNG